MIVNGAVVKFRGHVCDVVGDQALHVLQQRPKDKPVCLLTHFKAPHRSWIPAPRYAERFQHITIPEPRTYNDDLKEKPKAVRDSAMALADLPDFNARGCPGLLSRKEKRDCNLQELVKNYYRVLLSVDENVGRVLDYLDETGLAENTIVIYSSDNGFFLGDHGLMDKRLMYEESIRVPYLIRHLAAGRRGTVDSEHIVLNIDFAPTLLELTHIPVLSTMQGQSLAPLLRGERPAWRDSFLYEFYEYPGVHCVRKNRGIRTTRYKLIHYWELPEEYELYDLEHDPDETRNLVSDPAQAKLLADLKAQLAALRKATNDVDLPVTDPGPCEYGIGDPNRRPQTPRL
jgi:arylsulfatase A-like enzyme